MPITMVTASQATAFPARPRDSLLGPDHATTELRLTRRIYAGDRVKLGAHGRVVQLAEPGQQTRPDHAGRFRQQRGTGSFRRIKLLESISFLPNIACPPAF